MIFFPSVDDFETPYISSKFSICFAIKAILQVTTFSSFIEIHRLLQEIYNLLSACLVFYFMTVVWPAQSAFNNFIKS